MKDKKLKVRLVNSEPGNETLIGNCNLPMSGDSGSGDSGSGDSGSGDSGSGGSSYATGSCSVRGSITKDDITWSGSGYISWAATVEQRGTSAPSDPDNPTEPQFIVNLHSVSCDVSLTGSTIVSTTYNETTTKSGNTVVVLQTYLPTAGSQEILGTDEVTISFSHTIANIPLIITTTIIRAEDYNQGIPPTITSTTYNISANITFRLNYDPITHTFSTSEATISEINT